MSEQRNDPEREYWDEEARRVNDLCAKARQLGAVVPVNQGKPPELNKDGSLKKDGKK